MTATEPAAPADPQPDVPVVATEPQEGEGTDAVELVRTGWVRLRWDDKTVRLRRPFFGELKRLRLALEDASDAIAERSEEVQVIGRQILTENTANDEADTDELEKLEVRRELTKRSKIVGRELTAFSEEVRIDWWAQVAETLSADGPLPHPDELPSWIADPFLPNTVLQHWRSVPLDRG